ncbi:hypothetical protein VTN00DRAFT_7084 [Thermoascus crustaceus]|uniref:uncharacterized protein n=1 Tax=Thermoascus crustaceus TaxID=5088 RepID=UPI00374241D8
MEAGVTQHLGSPLGPAPTKVKLTIETAGPACFEDKNASSVAKLNYALQQHYLQEIEADQLSSRTSSRLGYHGYSGYLSVES